MNTFWFSAKKTGVVFFLLALTQVGACAGKEAPRYHGRGHHGPPPEAVEACKGHQEGDKVTFKTPRGDELTGICREFPTLLIAVPEGASPGKPDQDCPPERPF